MDEVKEVIEKELALKYEEATCKEETCLGCKVLEDCNDAKKHTRNLLKKRLSGAIGHEELMRLNDERFGPAKPRLIKHWKQILGVYEKDYIKIVNNPSIFDKLEMENQSMHRDIEKQLNYHGWVLPRIENAQLKFTTFHPPGKPVNKVNQDEPELDDDFIPEVEGVQGELL